jgi:hypothetical protein
MTYMCPNDHRHTLITSQIHNRRIGLLHYSQIIYMHLKYHGQDVTMSLNRDLAASKTKKVILEDIINDAASQLIENDPSERVERTNMIF